MWLEIKENGGAVQLSWGGEGGPAHQPYHVGLATLNANASAVRKSARALAAWGVGGDRSRLPEILNNIARDGHTLQFTLFSPMLPHETAAAAEARDYVDEQFAAGDHKLRISTHPNVHIPWGLVCERDPAPDGAAEIETFIDAFWCLRYSLSATLTGVGFARKLARASERRRLLTVVNTDVANAIGGQVRGAFDEWSALPIGRAPRLDDVPGKISGAGKGDTVLHFFGHQNGGELDLGPAGTIDVTRFNMLLERVVQLSGGPTESAGLVFINACDGALGDADYSFLTAASRVGMCGLISTESAVPRAYAAEFANRFLQSLFKGSSVGATMEELHKAKELWPLSLLYGCYAQPDYRFCGSITKS
jgi:hypothetical protein